MEKSDSRHPILLAVVIGLAGLLLAVGIALAFTGTVVLSFTNALFGTDFLRSTSSTRILSPEEIAGREQQALIEIVHFVHKQKAASH